MNRFITFMRIADLFCCLAQHTMLVMCVHAFDVRAMSTSSLNDTKRRILPSSSARVEHYSETVFRLIRPIVVWILRGCARHEMREISKGKRSGLTAHAMVIC